MRGMSQREKIGILKEQARHSGNGTLILFVIA